MQCFNPESVSPPFARYSHGVSISAGAELIFTSGQLAMKSDGSIPASAAAQARLCFSTITDILADANAGPADVIKINAFVTSRQHMAAYMEARDDWLKDITQLPASTLLIVSGFTRPEFLVEVEVIAAKYS